MSDTSSGLYFSKSNMRITATEARSRFGYVRVQAKKEPVFVERRGRVDTVILSPDQFEAMLRAAEQPIPKRLSCVSENSR